MEPTKQTFSWKVPAAISLALIVLLTLIISNGGLFRTNSAQNTQLHGTSAECQKLDAITLPQSPIPANTPAIIALSTTPENFSGTFTYSSNSGSLNDGQGNIGSYIQTSAKKITYSGGDDSTMITIQADGEQNKNCLLAIPVIKNPTTACEGLKVVTDPFPLPANQSAALTIIPAPENFSGTYLLQADSGEFQIQDADVQANGNLTKTLVTRSTNVLYNGGKEGEKIVVKALGANNAGCTAAIPITK